MNIMNYATREVLTVAPSDPIDRAIALMEERGIHHLIVTSDGRAIGMLSDRDILVSTGWMFGVERQAPAAAGGRIEVVGPRRVEQIMSRPVIGLTLANTGREAAQLMVQRRISAVPVVRDDVVVGIVTEHDLLRWLDELAFGNTAAERFLVRQVRDLMPARVVTVAPNTPLEDVIAIFRNFHVRHVPVAIGKVVVGMISDRDVRRAIGWSHTREMQAQADGRLPDAAAPNRASDIMHTPVHSIATAAPLRMALKTMLELRIHALPALDDRELAGIVTMSDFTRAISREELM